MKYFLDTEFVEDGRTIELVSIGIVAEDGREYYTEVTDADLSRADDWFRENVMPHLTHHTKSKRLIQRDLLEFRGQNPTFIAHFADYDWVALCQTLFGRMIDLPHGWPMFCLDTKQFEWTLVQAGVTVIRPEQKGVEHNALDDARFVRDLWNKLEMYYRRLIMFSSPTVASKMTNV